MAPQASSVESFYTDAEIKLRRVEMRVGSGQLFPLTGTRRQLKNLLFSLGNEKSLPARIDDDGEGGTLASWVVKGNRLEIGVDEDGDAYVLAVNKNGRDLLNKNFTSGQVDHSTLKTARNLLRQLGTMRAVGPSGTKGADTQG